MTKVLTIRVPPVLLSQADAKAARCGMDRTQYVRHLIESDLAMDESARLGKFQSEDLAGRFRLGGFSATNERVREQWRNRQTRHREAERGFDGFARADGDPAAKTSPFPQMSHPTALVQKLWNYCNILRDDGHEERQNEEGTNP